jgi:hypothetical protein
MSKEPGLIPDPDLGLPGLEEPMPTVEDPEPTQINDEEEL